MGLSETRVIRFQLNQHHMFIDTLTRGSKSESIEA